MNRFKFIIDIMIDDGYYQTNSSSLLLISSLAVAVVAVAVVVVAIAKVK